MSNIVMGKVHSVVVNGQQIHPPLDARPADLFPAILAAPDDDAPRLIYADWLDERGGPGWAAMIRWQVARPSHEIHVYWRKQDGWRFQHPAGDPDAVFDGIAELWRRVGPEMPVAVELAIRRGWVDEIRLTCGAFVGGRCERCGGDRRLTFPNCQRWDGVGNPDMVECPDCRGRGTRTPGLAAALAGRQPVTGVTLTDREPLNCRAALGASSNADSIWYVGPDLIRPSGEAIRNPHHLPPELGRLLTGWAPVTRRIVGGETFSLEHCRGYPSAELAHAALAAAALAYLRSLA